MYVPKCLKVRLNFALFIVRCSDLSYSSSNFSGTYGNTPQCTVNNVEYKQTLRHRLITAVVPHLFQQIVWIYCHYIWCNVVKNQFVCHFNYCFQLFSFCQWRCSCDKTIGVYHRNYFNYRCCVFGTDMSHICCMPCYSKV